MKVVVLLIVLVALVGILEAQRAPFQWNKRADNTQRRPILEKELSQLIKKIVRKQVNKAWKKIEHNLAPVDEITTLKDWTPEDHAYFVSELEGAKHYLKHLDEYLKRDDLSDEVYIRKDEERDKWRFRVERLENYVARSAKAIGLDQ